jgi:hypothetical protein
VLDSWNKKNFACDCRFVVLFCFFENGELEGGCNVLLFDLAEFEGLLLEVGLEVPDPGFGEGGVFERGRALLPFFSELLVLG